jgi:hypothetical protein
MDRYQASLPDELDLRPGMKLKVLRLYDDAWGTAVITSGGEEGENGKQGAFPIVRLTVPPFLFSQKNERLTGRYVFPKDQVSDPAPLLRARNRNSR